MQIAAFAMLASGVVVILVLGGLLLQQQGLLNAAQERADLAVAELDARQEELGLMLESTLDGMLRLDVQGNILFCNYAGAGLLGYDDPEELVGRHISQLCVSALTDDPPPASPQSAGLDWTKEVMRPEPLRTEGQQFCRKDGSQFPVRMLLASARHVGREKGALLAFSDITA
jgi:PAS domain S-box-containing protein